MTEREPSRKKGARNAATTLLLIAFCVATGMAFMALKVRADKVMRHKIPGASVIYIPSGKFLKYATFGYSALAADLVYLWAIQYYSTPTIVDRFQYLEHIFSITAELDPRYIDPYEIGAIIANAEAQDPEMAFRILDMGFEKNPDQWIFPFNAGHIAMMNLRDFERAKDYFEICMKIPGAPDFVERLHANAIFKKGDWQTSWETWLEIYETAPDERTKKIASNHLYNIKSTIDTDLLGRAAADFQKRFGRRPGELADLVRAGIIRAIPQDLDGQDYHYDPQTGEVKPPTIPWRR